MDREVLSTVQRNAQALIRLSRHEIYCDITFWDRPPLIGVRLSPALNAALMYGAGAEKMRELLDRVETRDGQSFRAADVWMIIEFPHGLPSDAELAEVNMSDGDAEVAPGVPMRQMAREIYHCADDEAAEQMLRRILAA